MRLSRPKLTHRAASAPVAPTVNKPVGEQTLASLRMLQNMGYKDVWCQATDVNEATLSEAAQEGWRVAAIAEGRIKMVRGSLPPSPLVPNSPHAARPAAPRRPSEQDLRTRAVTPPHREPPPSPMARLPKGQMSPEVAALIAQTHRDTGLGDMLPPLSPGQVLSPGMRQMYLRTQQDERRPSGASHRSEASQSSQKSSVPSVVVSPPVETAEYGDYFSHMPYSRPVMPPIGSPRRTPGTPRRQDSMDSSYTIDRIAEEMDSEQQPQPRHFAQAQPMPDIPTPPTPPAREVPEGGMRFEVAERRPLQQRLQRAAQQSDEYSYVFLPATPQVEVGGVVRRPTVSHSERLMPADDEPRPARSDPGHGSHSSVATPPVIPPRWNGLHRKQTPHQRK